MKSTATGPTPAKSAAPRKPRTRRSAPSSAGTERSADRPSNHEQRVREAAYFIYERSGRVDGRALENWLAAEALLLEEEAQAARREASGD
jgi:Protein of unknown function (DUF2934)